MIEVYFIRHGQASFGKPVYDRLSPLGEVQAGMLGNYLFRCRIHFDAIYSGGLKRQLQTASIVLDRQLAGKSPEIKIRPDFNEFDGSDQLMNRLHEVINSDSSLSDEMRTIHTQRDAISRIFSLAEKTKNLTIPEDERLLQMKAFRSRVSDAIRTLVDENSRMKRVAVFTSGGPITVALREALETSRDQTIRLSQEIRNTSVTVLRYDKRRATLVSFNSIAHLELQKDPDLITYI